MSYVQLFSMSYVKLFSMSYVSLLSMCFVLFFSMSDMQLLRMCYAPFSMSYVQPFKMVRFARGLPATPSPGGAWVIPLPLGHRPGPGSDQ